MKVRMNHPLSGNFLLSSLPFFIIALSSLLLVNSSGISSSSSSEEDKLTRGMSIRRNQALISESGRFALGFFNPGNSSNLYLGIWYNMIPEQTVVWVANRDSPIINNSNGVLMISDDGNLVLLEDTKPVWSSKISFLDVPMSSNSLVAVLENSGNFVLRDNTGIVLWQSFNNPTDTLLPGMEISMKVDDHGKRLTSWKDKDDPETGQFIIGLDPRGINQYFIWNKSRPYWRSDVWDGSLIHSSFQMPSKVALSFYYAAYHALDSSSILRFKLDRTGSVKVLSWKEENKKWVTSWQFPQDKCDFYNPCGSFGSCDINNSSHPCSCLQGFKPKVQEDWDSGDWSGGCVREKQLKCDEGDVFVRLEWKMKMPDDSFLLSNLSLKQCESECRRHCSCIAYAYCNDDPNVEWTPRCFHWVGNLRDVGRRYDYGGHDLYLRVRSSELGESVKVHKTRRSIVIVGMVTSAIGVLLIILLCGIMLQRKLKEQKWRTSSVTDINFKASNSFGSWNGSELISFSLSSILAATHNFSETTKLGEGGFGPVYKGSLPEGQEIAIKRLSKSSGQGQEEFMNEVTLIAKLQHKNLVRLIGCCIEKEEKMLIYEYLPNKSLDKFLFDPHKQVNLDWSVRFHIIEGIAQGLLYLHKYSRVRIIHRDLKASNVLLDSAMNPKISDFGMARIFGGNQTEANTARVVGTYGYMSPEYALNGHFSEKSDVFSFGVLLIEIVSSKRNTGFYSTDHAPTLLGYAWELWRQERALELLDQSIKDSCNDHEVLRCIQIGLLCVQEDPGARPTMSSVTFMLGNNSTNLSLPKQPATFVGRSSNNVNAGLSSKICSINEVTISSIESR